MACLVVSSTGLRAQLLAGLLSQCAPVAIAGACDSAAAAIAAIDRCRPELVIVDRDGDSDDCERIARHLLQGSTRARLILLSADARLEPLRRELAPLIDRLTTWQALLRCVRPCGEARVTPPEQADPLPEMSRFERLSPRERAVLELLGSGLGSRAIAEALGVSLQTVESYRKSVSAKLGVSGARLVRIAVLCSCVYPELLPGPVVGRSGKSQRRTAISREPANLDHGRAGDSAVAVQL